MRGPRKILTGKRIIARTSSSAPSTAIPRSRKGISNSQTIGYNTSASKASGQQKISKKHQSKNFTMIPSLYNCHQPYLLYARANQFVPKAEEYSSSCLRKNWPKLTCHFLRVLKP